MPPQPGGIRHSEQRKQRAQILLDKILQLERERGLSPKSSKELRAEDEESGSSLLLLERMHRTDPQRLRQLSPGSGDWKKESQSSVSQLEIRPGTIRPHFNLRMMKLGN